MTSRNVVLNTIAASVTLSLINGNAVAEPIAANASAVWTSDVDGKLQTGIAIDGSWTLAFFPGNNVSFSGVVVERQGPLTGPYGTSGAVLAPPPPAFFVTATDSFGTSTGSATSSIASLPLGSVGFFYSLSVDANVSLSNIFAPRAAALATGTDPQFVQTPGVFANIISLGAGSSVFTSEPDVGTADSTFSITAPLLTSDLADITLGTSPSGLEATVSFATDALLTFIDPLTGLPISAADVEARLEASTLDSMGGLTAPLPLFEYIYDLSGAQLPADASFGAVADSDAAAGTVPEPSTFTLLVLGLLGMLGYRWQKNQQD